jgi:hypothetical protein
VRYGNDGCVPNSQGAPPGGIGDWYPMLPKASN